MTAVSAAMRATIQARLAEIEAEEGLRVLFAVESGSRAWGFHSPDSDYDVRFVYARPLSWHFGLGKQRDVVERPIDAELDISGWERGKALRLMLASNAVIGEWLQSPISYGGQDWARQRLAVFATQTLDRRSVTWHYLSSIRGQEKRLFGVDGGIRLKRYFYMLRPALALRWIRLNAQAMPPMDMARLRAGCALSRAQAEALDRLTREKMAVGESAQTGARVAVLDALLAEEIEAAEAWLAQECRSQPHGLGAEAERLHEEITLKAFEKSAE